MTERSFDEMIAYFNRRVADMDISQGCKIELLGMVTALGYKHEKSAQRWIPCEDVLPYPGARVIVWARHTRLGVETSDILRYHGEKYGWENKDICTVIAWMPLPEPWR